MRHPSGLSEERRAAAVNRGHDAAPIEEVIAAFARVLRQKQASVTSRTVQKAVLVCAVRPMLCAHGIVRAQLVEFDSLPECLERDG